jgi:hypothetical protein
MRCVWSGWRAALVACVACFQFGAAWAQNVAVVTDVAGRVAEQEQLVILSRIARDARIQIGEGGRLVVIYLRSGDQYTFSGPAQIEFGATEPRVLAGTKPRRQASPLSRVDNPTIRSTDVTPGGLVMRGTLRSARIRLLGPAGTVTLETAPEFRWEEPEPKATYRFELFDGSGRSLYEASATGGVLRLVPAVQLLEGERYTWELSARLADGRRYVSSADFSVAPARLRAEADELRPAAGAPVSDRVAYAVWLDHVNLKDEARKYWKALAAERPDDARLRELAAD